MICETWLKFAWFIRYNKGKLSLTTALHIIQNIGQKMTPGGFLLIIKHVLSGDLCLEAGFVQS